MAELLEAQDIMFTPFEPKLKNRFIMNIEGIPAYMIKTAGRPQSTISCTSSNGMGKIISRIGNW